MIVIFVKMLVRFLIMKKRRIILGALMLLALSITACETSFGFIGNSTSSVTGKTSFDESSESSELNNTSSQDERTSSSANNESSSSSSSSISSSSSLLETFDVDISISNSALIFGDIVDIDISITPSIGMSYEAAISAGKLSISSSDSSVVKVDGLKLEALKKGEATITADYLGNVDSFDVTVSYRTVALDLYAFNDIHGNVRDTLGEGLGISRTTTALKELSENQNSVFISQGDMWQGSVESNYTRGNLVTEWMNSLDFVSMTVGNHEYDWGEEAIIQNRQLANFPTLGINVINRSTNERVDYLDPSVTFTRDGAKIGVIGAIGNCLSSISASKVGNVYFAKGDELTELVKDEATRLRDEEKCDFIIYSIHGSASRDSADQYDISLSNDNYVDLVLEGHTHDGYVEVDDGGVYHIQCKGYNNQISHIAVNVEIGGDVEVTDATLLDFSYSNSPYKAYDEDSDTNALFLKYYDCFSFAYETIGRVSETKNANALRNKVADLYLEEGLKKWGDDYDIILGGGYLSCRGSGRLPAGDVTYSQLATLFPFDNDIVLCSVMGVNLRNTSFVTGSSTYFTTWSSYGVSIKDSINNFDTYYLVTDTYSSDYKYNNLTVVDVLDENGKYARDLLADYIRAGKWEDTTPSNTGTVDNPKTIAEALEQAALYASESASPSYYFCGVVCQVASYLGNATGDMNSVYVKDADRNNYIQIYYLKKYEGVSKENNWQSVDDLAVGDVLVFSGSPYIYTSTSTGNQIPQFGSHTYAYSVNGIRTAP